MISHLDGEQIVEQAGIPVDEWIGLADEVNVLVEVIDKNLARWWAIIEYGKLGGDNSAVVREEGP